MKLVVEKNPEKRLSPEERKKRTGKSFVYHQSSQPFYKVKILMRNLEGEPELYVNRVEKKIYQIPQLIDFLKKLENIKKGIITIHGGAVTDQNLKGSLIAGGQDVGKTTFVFLLAKQGYYILGDDIVNISKNGIALRIQEKMGIFPHPENLKELSLSLKEKIIGRFKYYFIRIPFLYRFCYPNLRVDYKKIGKVLDEVEIHKIYILERGQPEICQISPKEGIRKILSSSLEIFFPEGFPKRFFYIYCLYNDFSPTFLEDNYKEILTSALEKKEFFVLRGKNPFDFYNLFLEHEKE